MLILGLLGMYFDAAVVFVTNSQLFFRLAVAILCIQILPQTSESLLLHSGFKSRGQPTLKLKKVVTIYAVIARKLQKFCKFIKANIFESKAHLQYNAPRHM